MFINMRVFFFRSDYLWLLSMLMTSPLVVTLGISLTVSILITSLLFFIKSNFVIQYRYLWH
jgi:solute carrier family 35 protein F5